MARTTIPVSKYPNVGKYPGIPPVQRAFNDVNAGVASVVTPIASGIALFRSLFTGPQWGIFSASKAPIIVGESVVAMEFRNEWRVADYPVEQGGFESYDKVAIPFDVRMTFTQGAGLIPLLGGDIARATFLTKVAAAAKSMALVTAVTPEKVYPSMNITHYDYSRTAKNGAKLLTVDIWLQEIRVTGTAQFTQTKSENGATPQNGGTQQPTAPSANLSAPAPSPTLA